VIFYYKFMNDFITQLQSALQLKNPLYIRVKVIPKSPKNEIVEVMADPSERSDGSSDRAGETYKIRIAAPAEGGKANAELLWFLKKFLHAKEVVIVSGKTERVKLIKLKL